MSNKLKGLLLFSLCLLAPIFIAGQVSPFNGRSVSVADSSSFTFIVTGHIHGASYNQSGFPASTILGNLDTLNALGPAMMVSLGDLFPELTEQIKTNYDKSLFRKLGFPLFNVVGNHDIGRGAYVKWYGSTYSYFIAGSTAFVFLDTEMDDGSIKNEQLSMLQDALKKADSLNIKNFFLFSHRPIWAEENSRYKGLFEGNTRTMIGKNNYHTEVLPALKKLTSKASVVWMSGSLSAAPVSFFYDVDPESRVVNIQTAVRELSRDAVLLVKVVNDKIDFQCISLTGQELRPLKEYDISFWKKGMKEEKGFNFRLLPYMTLLMVTHHYFWIGFGIGLLILIVAMRVVKRIKRRSL